MKKALLTGARGFIGRQAIPFLLERGYEVHAVGRTEQNISNVIFHACDLLNDDAQKLISKIKATHWLHFAWYVTPGKFWSSPENVTWTTASMRLFEHFAEAGGKRIMAAGTCAEYDWKHDFLSEIKTPLLPHTLYGMAKNSLREMIQKASAQTGISFAWGRIFFLYGPHEAKGRLVSELITKLLRNEPAPCTHGKQERDFMHVTDVARAFVETLESDHEGAVNIASGKTVTIAEVAQTIGNIIGRPELIQLGAYPTIENDPPRLAADTKILNKKIGFKPAYSLQAGLEETVEWWKRLV
ncbi:MAG: NAD-dependent epimerase/dehydratase family protein [Verrucomicrobiota bacterium]